VIVTGDTSSTNFPTHNAIQPTYAGGTDAIVVKLSPNLGTLLYGSYLGGSGFETGRGVSISNGDHIHLIAQTSSTNFPVVDALQSYGGGTFDAWVAELKIHPHNASFSWATFLGGSKADAGWSIVAQHPGTVYVTGETSSANFPTFDGFDSTYNG